MILTFIQKSAPGFPDKINAKNTFTMKTLHLLAEDFSENFNFAYVDLNKDEDWIGATFKV